MVIINIFFLSLVGQYRLHVLFSHWSFIKFWLLEYLKISGQAHMIILLPFDKYFNFTIGGSNMCKLKLSSNIEF